MQQSRSIFRWIRRAVICLIVGVSWNVWAHPIPEKIAHIYIDLASIPALAQMVDVVHQPAEDPKLFMWKRFYALPPDSPVLKALHATMSEVKYLGERNYEKFSELVDEKVSEFYKQYADYRFTVHLNARHIDKSGHIFDIIPAHQIKAIHLYEDSLGASYWDMDRLVRDYDNVPEVAPKFLHVGFYNPKFPPSLHNKVILMNFSEMAKSLSIEQKEIIAKLTGLNLYAISQIFWKRPTVVFVDDPLLELKRASVFLKKLAQQKQLQTYTWIYKNHPRVQHVSPVFFELKKYFPNVISLSNEVPLEVLIVCGYEPTYIAGYGSSIFFSFKAKQVLGYIERSLLETYLQPLLELKLLNKSQIFPLIREKLSFLRWRIEII